MIRCLVPKAARNRRPRQKGVVLVVALMFMLVMSIVGVTAMQSTIMQERMAGNVRDRNLAFQAAEAALRAGELAVRGNRKIAEETKLEDPAQWDGASPKETGTVANLGLPLGPVFYVDPEIEMPPSTPGSSTKALGATVNFAHKVTARGLGGTDKAVVILQSTVKLP